MPPPAASTAEAVDLSARAVIREAPGPAAAAAAADATSTTGVLSGLSVVGWINVNMNIIFMWFHPIDTI